MKKPRDLLIRAQETMDIPGQATPLEAVTSVTGFREVDVDRQKGLLAFSSTAILTAVPGGQVEVEGENLRIVLMKERRMVIRGRIRRVTLHREDEP